MSFGRRKERGARQSFRKVNGSKKRLRPRPRFVKPIQHGLRKEQNLI